MGNACGTIGLLHAAINNSTLTGGPVELKDKSWFKNFYQKVHVGFSLFFSLFLVKVCV